MITRRPYKWGDFFAVEEPVETGQTDFMTLALEFEKTDAYTWEVDGKIVACGGIAAVSPGVGEGWFRMAKNPPRWRTLVREMRRFILEEQIPSLNLTRFQVRVALHFPKGHAFAQFLGLQPESVYMTYALPERKA